MCLNTNKLMNQKKKYLNTKNKKLKKQKKSRKKNTEKIILWLFTQNKRKEYTGIYKFIQYLCMNKSWSFCGVCGGSSINYVMVNCKKHSI